MTDAERALLRVTADVVRILAQPCVPVPSDELIRLAAARRAVDDEAHAVAQAERRPIPWAAIRAAAVPVAPMQPEPFAAVAGRLVAAVQQVASLKGAVCGMRVTPGQFDAPELSGDTNHLTKGNK